MVVPDLVKPITMAEFKEFIDRPENTDTLYELINGEIIDVSPGRTSNSQIGHWIVTAVYPFCQAHDLPCYTSGGDGAYEILGNILAPDFAYKRTPMSDEYPDPEPPLWVVEIISPTDRADEIRQKRQIYVRAGILYWETYPLTRSVDVYPPGQPMRTVELDGILDAGEVLPGFTLPVKHLFPDT
jgi:Uma2 family endonuclease